MRTPVYVGTVQSPDETFDVFWCKHTRRVKMVDETGRPRFFRQSLQALALPNSPLHLACQQIDKKLGRV